MPFSLTKEQIDIQKAAREFAEGEFRTVARELDARETFDDRLWKKAAELGFRTKINTLTDRPRVTHLSLCLRYSGGLYADPY